MLGCETTGVASHRPGAAGTAAEQRAARSGSAAGVCGGVISRDQDREVVIAALYARVSTEKQEKDETIASQLDALHRAATEGGYEVAPEHIFVDAHHSGARLDRPALDKLRDLAAEGMFEAVLVYSPDRLARQYAHQVIVIEELSRAGCHVVFLNHAFGQSPEEQMLLQIQGVFAEYERALIKERLRRGRLFAARQGRAAWGNPPYGYTYIPKTDTTPQQLMVQEAEAEIVRQMYRWLIEEELSSYAIEKRLVTQRVPTRAGNKRGWCQSTVIGILRNPLYKGEGYYNRSCRAVSSRPARRRAEASRAPRHRSRASWLRSRRKRRL